MNELKELLKSEAGRSLKDFLLKKYFQLNRIDQLKQYGDKESQTIELKAAMKSSAWIRELLVDIGMAETTEEIKKAEEDFLFSL